jgi:hypothetical protein
MNIDNSQEGTLAARFVDARKEWFVAVPEIFDIVWANFVPMGLALAYSPSVDASR